MKVLLFQKNAKLYHNSGIGRAMQHQITALTLAGVDYTLDPKDNYDLVHLNTLGVASYRMAKRAKRAHKPIVYHAHSTEEDFLDSFRFSNFVAPLFNHRLLKCYKKGDVLVTPTRYSKSLLEAYHLKKPIYVVSNGICLEQYGYSEAKVAAYRKFFDIKEADKVIISIGYYFKRKGFQDFLAVAKELPDYKFIWFGYIPKIVQSQIVKKAIRHVPDNVCLPGYIKGDVIEGALADADLFFFPSYEETEGIVILEAMSSKTQVLLRNIPAYADWLEDKVQCYKGLTNEDFIRLIPAIVNQELPDTTDAAYEVIKQRSMAVVGQQLKVVYQDVLNKTEKKGQSS